MDNYSTSLSTQWADGSERAASSPITNNEYLVYTPRRTTVSASFLMGKLGVLAADYVHTDLREGELGDPGTILCPGTILRRRMWPWTAACKSSVKPGWAWNFAWGP